ncbi:hypothetical protein INT47_000450 [Mucor saturninus]|uniref:Uncharacterized protein n=1 Tax=Mucor saturninus TaxID=64648 RepID=A0A8H7QL49_9FUNG|nr:hypothetical protein INT47_000450 [Mucor saturninus]
MSCPRRFENAIFVLKSDLHGRKFFSTNRAKDWNFEAYSRYNQAEADSLNYETLMVWFKKDLDWLSMHELPRSVNSYILKLNEKATTQYSQIVSNTIIDEAREFSAQVSDSHGRSKQEEGCNVQRDSAADHEFFVEKEHVEQEFVVAEEHEENQPVQRNVGNAQPEIKMRKRCRKGHAINIELDVELYAPVFTSIMTSIKAGIIKDFDPLDPKHLANPVYSWYSEKACADITVVLHPNCCKHALLYLHNTRSHQVRSVGHSLINFGYISEEDLHH